MVGFKIRELVNQASQTPPLTEAKTKTQEVTSNPSESMQEYHQLFQKLVYVTLTLTAIIFIGVWIYYSLNTALNYLLGACTGVVYLRMLAKDVERLGNEKTSLSKSRFALFIGLMIVAARWDQLQVLPIFLGFLTYKATLFVYTVQSAFNSD
jgi:ATP synthase protein I